MTKTKRERNIKKEKVDKRRMQRRAKKRKSKRQTEKCREIEKLMVKNGCLPNITVSGREPPCGLDKSLNIVSSTKKPIYDQIGLHWPYIDTPMSIYGRQTPFTSKKTDENKVSHLKSSFLKHCSSIYILILNLKKYFQHFKVYFFFLLFLLKNHCRQWKIILV